MENTGQIPPQAAGSVLAVPIDEQGNIGALPEPLQRLMDARISDALKRGREKALATLPDPVERETLRKLEAENAALKQAELERSGRYEEALKMREAEYAKERERLQTDLQRRTEKLKRAAASEIRAAAVQFGAREQSLRELELILSAQVSLNAELDPIVLGPDGQPTDASIAQLVKGYLDANPHHRAAPAAGGGARGGSSLTQGVVGTAATEAEREVAVLRQRAQQSRDLSTINELFEAERRVKKAGG